MLQEPSYQLEDTMFLEPLDLEPRDGDQYGLVEPKLEWDESLICHSSTQTTCYTDTCNNLNTDPHYTTGVNDTRVPDHWQAESSSSKQRVDIKVEYQTMNQRSKYEHHADTLNDEEIDMLLLNNEQFESPSESSLVKRSGVQLATLRATKRPKPRKPSDHSRTPRWR